MVIDSHVLLWWLERDKRLSKRARDLLDFAAVNESAFYVASVTFWELYRKERLGGLQPRMTVRRWPELLRKAGWIEVVDGTPALWLATEELDWGHRDPADRLIAATALERGVPILTKDERFHADDSPVDAVW